MHLACDIAHDASIWTLLA